MLVIENATGTAVLRKTILAFSLFLAFQSNLNAAELILKVKDNPGINDMKDGDIVAAMNDKEIQRVHAENIIRQDVKANPSKGVPRPLNSMSKTFHEKTYQYKFERISETEVWRTDLWAGGSDMLSGTPNQNHEYIDVPLCLKRRMDRDDHLIFGTPGAEVWYGGNVRYQQADIDAVWAEIEAKTGKLKANHALWPLGTTEKFTHRSVLVDDFDDTTKAEYEKSDFDMTDIDNPVMLKSRKYRVDYKNLPGMKPKDKLDAGDDTKAFDLRAKGTFLRSLIVEEKA